jgi:hypothetical protein
MMFLACPRPIKESVPLDKLVKWGVLINNRVLSAIKEFANKHGYSDRQVISAMLDDFVKINEKLIENSEKDYRKYIVRYRREWV